MYNILFQAGRTGTNVEGFLSFWIIIAHLGIFNEKEPFSARDKNAMRAQSTSCCGGARGVGDDAEVSMARDPNGVAALPSSIVRWCVDRLKG